MDALQNFAGYHARFGQSHLIEQNEGVHVSGQLKRRVQNLSLYEGRRGSPVFAVEPIEFLRRFVRIYQERLAVGKRAAEIGRQEMPEPHAWAALQGQTQFKTFAVLAAKSNRMNLTDTERRKIVQDRPGSAWLRTDVDDVVNGQAGFNRDFLPGWIHLEIPVEAEIADDRHAEAGVTVGDLLESGEVHLNEHSERLQRVKQVPQKHHVVALDIAHRAAHARITLAETQIIGRIVLRRLAFGPVPVAAVLQIDHVNCMILDDGPPGLQPQVVHTAQTLFKNLRPHDRRANGEHHAAVELFDRGAEEAKIQLGGASDGCAVEHRVIRDDVVADSGMNREGNLLAKGIRQHAGVTETMKRHVTTGRQLVPPHRQQQFGAGGREAVGRFLAELHFQRLDRGQGSAVFVNESAQRAP